MDTSSKQRKKAPKKEVSTLPVNRKPRVTSQKYGDKKQNILLEEFNLPKDEESLSDSFDDDDCLPLVFHKQSLNVNSSEEVKENTSCSTEKVQGNSGNINNTELLCSTTTFSNMDTTVANPIASTSKCSQPKRKNIFKFQIQHEKPEEKLETKIKTAAKRTHRRMLRDDELADETKLSTANELNRFQKLKQHKEELQKLLAEYADDGKRLILDYDSRLTQNIEVEPALVNELKPHQVDGVKFMYESCYGNVNCLNVKQSGCILAHCMGLGKTLQVITLIHTLIKYPQFQTDRIIILCPKCIILNWSEEIDRWMNLISDAPKPKVFQFPDFANTTDKIEILENWYESISSSILLIGYDAFRALMVHKSKNLKNPNDTHFSKKISKFLLNPGADLIICDEGHVIKNNKSKINEAISEIKTSRRIILTGTPLQNNLIEYYCMVHFIKPFYLGTIEEFRNRFEKPIKMGAHKDSSIEDILQMKQRTHVLHNQLSSFVQRRETGILNEYLPNKFEYVLFIPLTDAQEELYEYFLENCIPDKPMLIADYTCLRKIWTHPKVLEIAYNNALELKNKNKLKKFKNTASDIDSEQPIFLPDDVSLDELFANPGYESAVLNDWWRTFLSEDVLECMLASNKFKVMFEILNMCKNRGDKCLIFSSYVAVLNVVEYFMSKINNNTCNLENGNIFTGTWVAGLDYYRLDGSTGKTERQQLITKFNDPLNNRIRCFLISTKAGGQGINLHGANRVIILDTSWNPSSDQQSIFRIYRLGQIKECYIYRLLAMGTMEEKVYSRSVTKQAMSRRVIDNQQVDRHYTFAELEELYIYTKPDLGMSRIPILPNDHILAVLLKKFPNHILQYHVHDSMLENTTESELTTEQKLEAWNNFEKTGKTRKVHRKRTPRSNNNDFCFDSDLENELDDEFESDDEDLKPYMKDEESD